MTGENDGAKRTIAFTESPPDRRQGVYWELNVVLTSVLLAFIISSSFEEHVLVESGSLRGVPLYALLSLYGFIIWSQIGYLSSVARKPYLSPIRFFPDMSILFLYGYVTWNVTEVAAIVSTVPLIFAGYWLWDLLKLYEWRHEYSITDAYRIGITTLVLLGASSVWFVDRYWGYQLRSGLFGTWNAALLQIGFLALFWILKSRTFDERVWSRWFS